MIAAHVSTENQTERRLRPINLLKDVPQVLELLDLVFRPTLRSYERHNLHSSLSLNHTSWFVMRLSQSATGVTPGFVWEEDGRIVGNASLLSARPAGRFLVANVAVHPQYRQRGIGRQLMVKVIEVVRAHHGQAILLQVETGNEAAIRLYDSLDFDHIGEITSWVVAPSQLRPLAAGSLSPAIRPLQRQEWYQAYALDRACQHPDLTWPEPLAQDSYKQGLRQWLDRFINSRHKETWVTRDADDELTGLAAIDTPWSGSHRLTLRITPSARGQLERPLLAKLLRRLNYLKRRHIRCEHQANDQRVKELLQEANFQHERTLTTMRLDLN